MLESPHQPQQTSGGSRRGAGGAPWWAWAIGLIVIAAAFIMRSSAPRETAVFVAGIPFAELGHIEIDPAAKPVDHLPLSPGALKGQNVLLVTLDTTRADRIGCYGNKRAHTPTIDRLARQGAVFARAFAAAPTTLPAHASIMTGQYPVHHGARVNGVYQLDDDRVTLAESLSAAGYRTGATVSSFVLDRQFGLAQGFDQYDDDVSSGEQIPYRFNEIKADATTDRAIAWFRAAGDDARPFFYWAHYFDPHSVYQPPAKYLAESVGPYDGEITFVDAQLARLLDELRTTGRLDRTLIVVVADHGEALTQHDESSHGYLVYNSTLRIPLIISHPAVEGPVQVTTVVSQVDIVPTVLSLLGLQAPPAVDGVNLTQRVALRPIFGETLQGYQSQGWAPLFTVLQGSQKLIHGPTLELFDYERDPREESNLAAKQPGRAQALDQLLRDEFGDELDSISTHAMKADAETLQRLAALGYTDLSATPPVTSQPADPREMMHVYRQVEEAVFTEQGITELSDRITALERICRQHPDFIPAMRYLADAYLKSGRARDAEALYTRALRLQPSSMELRIGLAASKHKLGEYAPAIDIIRGVVSDFPVYTRARFTLAAYLLEVGKFDESADQFRDVFDREPSYKNLDKAIVEAFSRADRLEELAAYLEKRYAAEPQSASIRSAYGNCLLKLGRVREAGALLGAAPRSGTTP